MPHCLLCIVMIVLVIIIIIIIVIIIIVIVIIIIIIITIVIIKMIIRRFGTKCSGCGQGISPQDLVRKARDKVQIISIMRKMMRVMMWMAPAVAMKEIFMMIMISS